jgi:hypothetical protein
MQKYATRGHASRRPAGRSESLGDTGDIGPERASVTGVKQAAHREKLVKQRAVAIRNVLMASPQAAEYTMGG